MKQKLKFAIDFWEKRIYNVIYMKHNEDCVKAKLSFEESAAFSRIN